MKIVQIGIVVHDAAGTARRYAELFGVGPWTFLDITPTDTRLHGQPLEGEAATVRVALADLGGIQIELLQPLAGPSTHREFLEAHGQGIHHVSFGRTENHDAIVGALAENGIGIEMQGVMGGADTFTYMATQKQLGTIFELVKPADAEKESTLSIWGTYEAPGPGRIDLAGKRIVQVGIVVEDAEATAKRYLELLGIGPWVLIDFAPPHVARGYLHGVAIDDQAGVRVRAALAQHEGLEIELLEPVAGPSTHMEFLQAHGQGIHHLSFGPVPDHDEVVEVLREEGVAVEMTGELGGASTFTYMAGQAALGTIFEVVKIHPGAESTLVPYGSLPSGSLPPGTPPSQ